MLYYIHILVNMINRTIFRHFAALEFHGTIYAPHWEITPEWNNLCVKRNESDVKEALEIADRISGMNPINIADLLSASGQNSVSILKLGLQQIRANTSKDVSIFATYLPTANWSEWFKYALDEKNYGSISNLYLYGRPGNVFKRLHPYNTIHFVYANHILMPISKLMTTEDTIWPAFTSDVSIRNIHKEISIKDLTDIITHRAQELCKGGRFIFNTLAPTNIPKESPWLLLNQIVEEYTKKHKITPEERQKIGFRYYFRSDEEINSALNNTQSLMRLIKKEVYTDRFFAYDEYLSTKDAQKLGRIYSEWLKELTGPSIMMALSPYRSQERKIELLNEIFEQLTERCIAHPAPCELSFNEIILERI